MMSVHVTSSYVITSRLLLNVELRNYVISSQIVIKILWYHCIAIEHTY